MLQLTKLPDNLEAQIPLALQRVLEFYESIHLDSVKNVEGGLKWIKKK